MQNWAAERGSRVRSPVAVLSPEGNATKISSIITYVLNTQGSTLRPVGSPMRLDFLHWRLTFHSWSPGWPQDFFDLVLKFLIEFNTLILLCSCMKPMKSCSFDFGYFIYLLANAK